MAKGLVGLLVMVLLMPLPASAQLAVADAPVLSAIVTVGATISTMLSEIQQQAAALANWAAIIQELQAIAQLLADVEALIQEVESLGDGWGQLMTSGNALCTIDEAVSWKGQALQWKQRGLGVAFRAHRLMGRTVNVLRSLQTVLAGIVGSASGAQSASALLSVIAANLEQLQSMTGAFQAAAMGPDVIESVIGIHLVCIHDQQHMADWGSYSYR